MTARLVRALATLLVAITKVLLALRVGERARRDNRTRDSRHRRLAFLGQLRERGFLDAYAGLMGREERNRDADRGAPAGAEFGFVAAGQRRFGRDVGRLQCLRERDARPLFLEAPVEQDDRRAAGACLRDGSIPRQRERGVH